MHGEKIARDNTLGLGDEYKEVIKMGELDGKVGIVTGAGRLRGIGRAAAVALAKLGADVLVIGTGRTPDTFPPDEKTASWKGLESTAEQVNAEGRRGVPLIVDISNSDDVQMMVDSAMQEFGRIDILINNAAFARGPDRVPILELDDGIFQKVMDVKVLGTYLCTKAVIKVLKDQDQGGKIVNVASAAGKRGGASMLAYNAANFAVVGMTQSMARELGPDKINVNCVCPGPTRTSRVDDLNKGGRWQKLIEQMPIGRPGTDTEVGDFIAYLCTTAASWIHGQSININGGLVMEH